MRHGARHPSRLPRCAPGVGKTHAMLAEGHRRRERGADVVVAMVGMHNRPNTIAQLRDLEVMPRRTIEYRATTFEEMDIDAVLARRPESALVDERAHTNVVGSQNAKRWRDVQQLLATGIDVISTLNIQHFESLNDVVERITGAGQREIVPDAVVRAADQIELVDLSPEALRRRMAHGNVYPAERIDAALGNYFGPATSARCPNWRCCGPPTGSKTHSTSTTPTKGSPRPGKQRTRRGGGDRCTRQRCARGPGHAPRGIDRRRRVADRRAVADRNRSTTTTASKPRSTDWSGVG